ncbi:hypothetical protein [Bradyrhizobium arachidis]|uniref:hypothetical protein n=1 Tax=Bradyrhizobium arachidis TaxID=858423 RepID=UPI002162CABF|nr:hypothetical protein [Bradyrhizobium arachidis]
MELNKILQFPAPANDLSPEELASRLTHLAEELETALSSRAEGYAQRLASIEKASIVLKDISFLVSRGRERKRATETFERIMHSTAELKSRLSG